MAFLESPDFAARLEKLMEEWHVPGTSIAVIQNDKVSSKAFGLASIEKKTPMTPDTLCNIASCSKSFTAGLLGIAIAEKRYPDLQWDSVVSSLLPGEFVLSSEKYTESVTIDDIISHRSGQPGYDTALFGPRGSHPDTPKTITNNMRNLPMNAPLRTSCQYNNLMFSVAAYVHQHLSGSSWTDSLQKEIFQPLGMNTSFVHMSGIPSQLESKFSSAYTWREESGYRLIEQVDQPEGEGAGCIITTAEDHIRWVEAMINSTGPITPEVRKELIRPRVIDDSWEYRSHPYTSPDLYAAGWYIRNYHGHQIAFHGGSDVGFGTFTFFLPDRKVGGVIHGNSTKAPDYTFVAGMVVIDLLLEIPESQRPDWSQIIKDDDSDNDEEKALKDTTNDQPQTRPLEQYTGHYWHPGYKNIKVEIKDGQLSVDFSDRGYPSILTLEHISEQTNYRGRLAYDGWTTVTKGKFEFEGETVTKVGLKLDDTMIWFDKARVLAIR